MNILKKSKAGETVKFEEINEIFNNLEKLDHHDCVRVDQILTRIYNERETEFQWGSVCMNAKWETL